MQVKLGSLNTNGFVTTSSSNGTLTVDTTSYLPSTGGVLYSKVIRFQQIQT
jgi:hypothetical protein